MSGNDYQQSKINLSREEPSIIGMICSVIISSKHILFILTAKQGINKFSVLLDIFNVSRGKKTLNHVIGNIIINIICIININIIIIIMICVFKIMI